MTSPLSMGGGAGAARVDLIRDGLPDVMRRIAPQSVDIPATRREGKIEEVVLPVLEHTIDVPEQLQAPVSERIAEQIADIPAPQIWSAAAPAPVMVRALR